MSKSAAVRLILRTFEVDAAPKASTADLPKRPMMARRTIDFIFGYELYGTIYCNSVVSRHVISSIKRRTGRTSTPYRVNRKIQQLSRLKATQFYTAHSNNRWLLLLFFRLGLQSTSSGQSFKNGVTKTLIKDRFHETVT